MTAIALPATKRWTATWVLAALAVVVFVIALLTPEEVGTSGRDASTFSTGPTGASIALELAERMRWKTERRTVPLDSVAGGRRVDVLLAPPMPLGAHEVHKLLQNVRSGGGLIATLDGDEELADSLGVEEGRGTALLDATDADCPDERFSASRILTIPPDGREVEPSKIRDADVTTLLSATPPRARIPFRAAIGFPLSAGRVVVVGSSSVFNNAAIRDCGRGADLAVARMFDYVRPRDDSQPPMVFDEYHHGYGIHGGSLRAASIYLGKTSSGHFLVQALVAGLLLLLAKAPRPLPPRDAAQIPRRSPIEHAEALGRAFEDVGATRTATTRLLGGVRRRVGRAVAVSPGASDDDFLNAVERMNPSISEQARQVRGALAGPIPPQQFVLAGNALERIERVLTRD